MFVSGCRLDVDRKFTGYEPDALIIPSEEVKIISQPSAPAGPQPYTQNYPPYGRPPIQYPDYGGYVLNDLPPLGYGSLPGPAGRPNDYERYNPSRTNTIKSEPNVNRVKRGKSNAYAKVKKWVLDDQFPGKSFQFGIILNDFRSSTISFSYSSFIRWVQKS